MWYLFLVQVLKLRRKKIVLKVSGLWNVSKGKGTKKCLRSQLTYHHDSFLPCAYFCYFLQKKEVQFCNICLEGLRKVHSWNALQLTKPSRAACGRASICATHRILCMYKGRWLQLRYRLISCNRKELSANNTSFPQHFRKKFMAFCCYMEVF